MQVVQEMQEMMAARRKAMIFYVNFLHRSINIYPLPNMLPHATSTLRINKYETTSHDTLSQFLKLYIYIYVCMKYIIYI